MVSPLKTWQHPQPKGLWPTVTGLAVATHVGVLGLSLPYVLNLMRSGERKTATFVPVELIEVESTATSGEETAREVDAFDVKAGQNTSATAERRAVAESTAQPVKANSNNVLNTPSEADTSAVPKPKEEDAESDSETTPEQAVQPDIENETASETDVDSAENSTGDGTVNSDLESESSQANEPVEADLGEPDVESTPTANTQSNSESSRTTEPPIISGEQELPLPSEESTTVSSAQVAYIRVIGHSYVPKELRRDIADTLPEPINYSDVQLDTEAVDCGLVDFPVGQVTYRVVVDSVGRMKRALPWTGGIEGVQMSEGERAIACLIESAGFTFTPAISVDTAVANSDLILTLDIIESSGD